MEGLMSRAAQLAAAERARAVRRMTDEFGARLAGAEVEQSEAGVTLSGRGLLRRWLSDPGARFVASMR